MKKFIVLIMIGFAPLFFWSCSNNNSNPVNPTTSNYFPLHTGNYWIYEKYTLDSANNQITTSLKIDSVYCTSISQDLINDSVQSVYTFSHYSSGMIDPEQKFYISNDKIYQKYQIVPGIDLSALGINVNEYLNIDWLLLIDQKNASWVSYPSKTIELPSINFPTVGDVNITLTLEFVGESKGIGTYVLNNKTISTKDYELDWNVSGTAKIPTLGNIAIPIPVFTLKTVYKLADQIGIVSIKTDSKTVSIAGLTSFQFPGSEQNLIRYQIIDK